MINRSRLNIKRVLWSDSRALRSSLFFVDCNVAGDDMRCVVLAESVVC